MFLRLVVMTRFHLLLGRGAGLPTFHASTRIIMHNRQALKQWRRHGDIKLEHRDETDRMVAQSLINGILGM